MQHARLGALGGGRVKVDEAARRVAQAPSSIGESITGYHAMIDGTVVANPSAAYLLDVLAGAVECRADGYTRFVCPDFPAHSHWRVEARAAPHAAPQVFSSR